MTKTALAYRAADNAVRDVFLDQDFLPGVEFHHFVTMRTRLLRERDTAVADEESAYRNEICCWLQRHTFLITTGTVLAFGELEDFFHEHLPGDHSAIPVDHPIRLVSEKLREFLPGEA